MRADGAAVTEVAVDTKPISVRLIWKSFCRRGARGPNPAERIVVAA
jgi:hypothetical protein